MSEYSRRIAGWYLVSCVVMLPMFGWWYFSLVYFLWLFLVSHDDELETLAEQEAPNA